MKKCDYHDECIEKINDKITESSICLARLENDISWITKNIEKAIDKKRWLIATILSIIALGLSLFSKGI